MNRGSRGGGWRAQPPEGESRLPPRVARTRLRFHPLVFIAPGITALILIAIWVCVSVHLVAAQITADREAALACEAVLASFTAHVSRNIHDVDLRLNWMKFASAQSSVRLDAHGYDQGGLMSPVRGEQAVTVDAQGSVVMSTAPLDERERALLQAQFLAQREHPEMGLLVGATQPDVRTGNWSVLFSRRFIRPQGVFGGMVAILEPMDYLARGFLSTQALGSRGLFAVVSEQGQVLLRLVNGQQPARGEVGLNVAVPDTRVTKFIDPVDGSVRIGSATRLQGYPLTVVTAVEYAQVAGAYAKARLRALLLAALGSLLVVLAGVSLTLTARTLQIASNTDALTGLGNRRMLLALLRRRVGPRRSPGRLAMLYIDLDGFKRINDSLGHHGGDELLVEFARRLSELARNERAVARIGDDEFVVVLERDDVASVATRLARQICEMLTNPLPAAGQDCVVHASIGVAELECDTGSALEFLARADHAMYAAKRIGRTTGVSSVQHDTPALFALARRQAELRLELGMAIERREFSLAYQPIVSLDGELLAVEALLRWQHPQLGACAAGDFIPLAEATGQIIAIGAFVLESACRDARRWREAHRRPVLLSVNASPKQLIQPGYAREVLQCLRAYGLPPAQLQIEVTETAMLEGAASVRQQIGLLRQAGVRVVLDDFGSGYSSLSHLLSLAVDGIKIDSTLTRDIPRRKEACTLLDSLVDLTRRLDLSLVVEGVETREQVDWLAARGQVVVQGHYFARAQAASALEAMMAEV